MTVELPPLPPHLRFRVVLSLVLRRCASASVSLFVYFLLLRICPPRYFKLWPTLDVTVPSTKPLPLMSGEEIRTTGKAITVHREVTMVNEMRRRVKALKASETTVNPTPTKALEDMEDRVIGMTNKEGTMVSAISKEPRVAATMVLAIIHSQHVKGGQGQQGGRHSGGGGQHKPHNDGGGKPNDVSNGDPNPKDDSSQNGATSLPRSNTASTSEIPLLSRAFTITLTSTLDGSTISLPVVAQTRVVTSNQSGANPSTLAMLTTLTLSEAGTAIPSSQSVGLTGGPVAGIVIGCIVFLVMVVGAGTFFLRKLRMKHKGRASVRRLPTTTGLIRLRSNDSYEARNYRDRDSVRTDEIRGWKLGATIEHSV